MLHTRLSRVKILLTTLIGGLTLGLTALPPAEAKLIAQDVDYQAQNQALQGYLVYDDAKAKPGQTPGLVMFHAWMGIQEHEKDWARKLAEEGYVVFAADIYGKGIRPHTPQEAGQQAGIYRQNRALMRARAQTGLDVLSHNPLVNPHKIGALGFCFGGGVALELARAGAPLQAVVSLHGNLDTPNPKDAQNIKGAILALHGGNDPYVNSEQVQAFQAEMRAAKVDWQMNLYGGAVHAFTDPSAGRDPSKGAAYNPEAARRAWNAMVRFFAERLK